MNIIVIKLMFVATLALLVTACSPSAAKLTNAGNEAFAKQAYEEALQAYAEAQAKSPELAEPYYNLANVLYREGKYEEALKTLQQAAQIAQIGQMALAAHSYFNAGNAAFNTKGWEAAIESYRQALLRNPTDLDAKHNLELALQQNQDRQQQDQQNQDQQQDDQGQQDQQNQSQQDQQKKQNQQNQDQQQNDQGQRDQQNQSQQDQSQSQQDQSQDGQQDQDQRDQQDQGQPQAGKQQESQPQSGPQLAPGQRMTQEQARQLLAAIAGKSDTLQGRLGQLLRVRGRPPVQDW